MPPPPQLADDRASFRGVCTIQAHDIRLDPVHVNLSEPPRPERSTDAIDGTVIPRQSDQVPRCG